MEDLAFDENGQPVPSVPFEFPKEVEAGSEEVALARQEAIIRTLAFLTADEEEPHRIGARTMLLAHILRPQHTQRELAALLSISQGRVWQLLVEIRQEIASKSGVFDPCE
jgi:hypothetical protein